MARRRGQAIPSANRSPSANPSGSVATHVPEASAGRQRDDSRLLVFAVLYFAYAGSLSLVV